MLHMPVDEGLPMLKVRPYETIAWNNQLHATISVVMILNLVLNTSFMPTFLASTWKFQNHVSIRIQYEVRVTAVSCYVKCVPHAVIILGCHA